MTPEYLNRITEITEDYLAGGIDTETLAEQFEDVEAARARANDPQPFSTVFLATFPHLKDSQFCR